MEDLNININLNVKQVIMFSFCLGFGWTIGKELFMGIILLSDIIWSLL